MYWGSNKYGQKKLYKLERFFVPTRNNAIAILFIIGGNISYFLLALHYKRLEHDHWMRSYGEFFPLYSKIGEFTIRSYCIIYKEINFKLEKSLFIFIIGNSFLLKDFLNMICELFSFLPDTKMQL
jgi:hypothetical protein